MLPAAPVTTTTVGFLDLYCFTRGCSKSVSRRTSDTYDSCTWNLKSYRGSSSQLVGSRRLLHSTQRHTIIDSRVGWFASRRCAEEHEQTRRTRTMDACICLVKLSTRFISLGCSGSRFANKYPVCRRQLRKSWQQIENLASLDRGGNLAVDRHGS